MNIHDSVLYFFFFLFRRWTYTLTKEESDIYLELKKHNLLVFDNTDSSSVGNLIHTPQFESIKPTQPGNKTGKTVMRRRSERHG